MSPWVARPMPVHPKCMPSPTWTRSILPSQVGPSQYWKVERPWSVRPAKPCISAYQPEMPRWAPSETPKSAP